MYVYKLFLRMPVQSNENIKVALMFMNDCITCLSILTFNCQYSLVVRLSKTTKYKIQYTGDRTGKHFVQNGNDQSNLEKPGVKRTRLGSVEYCTVHSV